MTTKKYNLDDAKVNIPKKVHYRMKVFTSQNRMSMRDFTTEAIEREIARRQAEAAHVDSIRVKDDG